MKCDHCCRDGLGRDDRLPRNWRRQLYKLYDDPPDLLVLCHTCKDSWVLPEMVLEDGTPVYVSLEHYLKGKVLL